MAHRVSISFMYVYPFHAVAFLHLLTEEPVSLPGFSAIVKAEESRCPQSRCSDGERRLEHHPTLTGSCQDREASPSVRKVSKLPKTLLFTTKGQRQGWASRSRHPFVFVSLSSCPCEYINLALLVHECTGATSFKET